MLQVRSPPRQLPHPHIVPTQDFLLQPISKLTRSATCLYQLNSINEEDGVRYLSRTCVSVTSCGWPTGSTAMAELHAKGPQARTTVVLSVTFILERLDEQILTAVYTPLGKSLHATPSQLGSLTLCRALVQVSLGP